MSPVLANLSLCFQHQNMAGYGAAAPPLLPDRSPMNIQRGIESQRSVLQSCL